MRYSYRDGRVEEVKSSQDKTLRLLYSNFLGRSILKLLTKPCVSKIGGAFMNSGLSTGLIPGFIKKNNIDLEDYENTFYNSYNDFFTRKIKPEKRPIDDNDSHFISPSDGKVTSYEIKEDLTFTVKNTEYTIESILRNRKLAEKYKEGNVTIIRLTVDNYHRYCYLDHGIKSRNKFIQGVLHTVNPIANDYYKIYKENSREYTILRTENFGDVIQIEVGALMVGKISNHHKAWNFQKGDEKGMFEFGGSTIVLITKKENVIIDQDIIDNSKEDIETIVKMGERIGIKNSNKE